MGKKRFYDISTLKGVSLLCVMLAHSMYFFYDSPFVMEKAGVTSSAAGVIINFFDATVIASFMFASGFLWCHSRQKKNVGFLADVAERARRLLLPYFLVGTLWLVPLYTFFDVNAYGRSEGAGYLEGYKAMILGQFSDHLWFLWALFWISVIWAALKVFATRERIWLGLLLSLAIGIFVDKALYWFPYFKLSQIGPYMLPFALGIAFRLYQDKMEKLGAAAALFIGGALFACLLVYSFLLPTGLAVTYIVKIAGALMSYFLFCGIDKAVSLEGLSHFVPYAYYEKHSMNYYLLHLPTVYLLFRVLWPMLGGRMFVTVALVFVLDILITTAVVAILDVILGIIKGARYRQ